MWRYRFDRTSSDNYYALGDNVGEKTINGWKVADKLLGYTSIVLCGVISVTQIMTMFYGMGYIYNHNIVYYGGIFAGIVETLVWVILFRTYQNAYNVAEVYDIYSVAEKADATSLMGVIGEDMAWLLTN